MTQNPKSAAARMMLAANFWLRLLVSLTLVSSSFCYTTAGFDFEIETPGGVDVSYVRLRWDDGSFWIGRAIQPCQRPHRPLEWFDPGGTLLAAPTWPIRRTWWNTIGFWNVTAPANDPYVSPRYPGATDSHWWAVPSWLILVGLWFPVSWRWCGRMRKQRNARGFAAHG